MNPKILCIMVLVIAGSIEQIEATTPTPDSPELTPSPESFIESPIPLYKSEYEGWCGCTSIQYSMRYYGIKKTQSKICKDLGKGPGSTFQSIREMYYYLYKEGLDVDYHNNLDYSWSMTKLKSYLESDYPVILLQRTLPNDGVGGHYRIALSYIKDEKIVNNEVWRYIKINDSNEHTLYNDEGFGTIIDGNSFVFYDSWIGGLIWFNESEMKELWKANWETQYPNQMIVVKGLRF